MVGEGEGVEGASNVGTFNKLEAASTEICAPTRMTCPWARTVGHRWSESYIFLIF